MNMLGSICFITLTFVIVLASEDPCRTDQNTPSREFFPSVIYELNYITNETHPIRVHNDYWIVNGINERAFSGWISFARPFNNLQLYVNLTWCSDYESPDCEIQPEYFLGDICKDLHRDNRIWSSLIERLDYNEECPIPAGNFSFNNASIDLANMDFCLEPGFWNCHFYIVSNDKVVGEFEEEWRVKYVSN